MAAVLAAVVVGAVVFGGGVYWFIGHAMHGMLIEAPTTASRLAAVRASSAPSGWD